MENFVNRVTFDAKRSDKLDRINFIFQYRRFETGNAYGLQYNLLLHVQKQRVRKNRGIVSYPS